MAYATSSKSMGPPWKDPLEELAEYLAEQEYCGSRDDFDLIVDEANLNGKLGSLTQYGLPDFKEALWEIRQAKVVGEDKTFSEVAEQQDVECFTEAARLLNLSIFSDPSMEKHND